MTLRRILTTTPTSLPLVFALAIIAWGNEHWGDLFQWLGFAFAVGATLLVLYISNQIGLIRERSWLLPSLFLWVGALTPFIQTFAKEWISVFAVIMSIHFLLRSYQQMHPEYSVFHAYFFLGVAILICPSLAMLALFYFIALIFQLHAFTPHSLVAALLALVAVGELYFVGNFFWGSIDDIPDKFSQMLVFHPIGVLEWDCQHWVALGITVIPFLVGSIHFYQNYYQDKISIRLFYYVLLTLAFACLAMLFLVPSEFNTLYLLFSFFSVPVVAHYFVLGKGGIVGVFFYIALFVSIIVFVYNLWIS